VESTIRKDSYESFSRLSAGQRVRRSNRLTCSSKRIS